VMNVRRMWSVTPAIQGVGDPAAPQWDKSLKGVRG
jgi:hypothetical protein